MHSAAQAMLALVLLSSAVHAADIFGSVPAPDADLAESVLQIARKADPDTDIDSARAAFEALVAKARERISGGSAPDKTEALARLLTDEGFVAAENGRRRGSMLLPAVLETRRGNCMGFSLLYVCLAQRLKLPLKIALIPEHAFIVCEDGSSRICVETLLRGAKYASFNEFMAARAETVLATDFRIERATADSVAEALRLDQRLQSRDISPVATRQVVLHSPREILALLLTQVAGELDAPGDSALRLEFCSRAVAWHPRLAVAQESLGHFLRQQSGLSAAREKLLTASTLQQEQGWLQSALRSASASGSAERVRELLKKGAPVRARDAQGRPPLHFASSGDIVRLLLAAGAELHATSHDGTSALHFAAKFGSDEATEALLAAGAKPALLDAYGRAPLHYAALYDHERALERLLLRGAEVDALTTSGWSPLHLAAQSGSTHALLALLKSGAQVALKNGTGATALNVAAANDRLDAARALLDAGSSPSDADGDGVTPLHWAARRGQAALVKLLIERGADVNARERDGRTPLIFNAFSSSTESARLLLEHGANANSVSRVGRTALHHAAHFNNVALMKLLLNHGANAQLADAYGRVPFDYCNSATRDALK